MKLAWWEIQHKFWMEDINFELYFIAKLKFYIKQNPDNSTGDMLRHMLKENEKYLKKVLSDYKKIYGDIPNIRQIKKNIEEDITKTPFKDWRDYAKNEEPFSRRSQNH